MAPLDGNVLAGDSITRMLVRRPSAERLRPLRILFLASATDSAVARASGGPSIVFSLDVIPNRWAGQHDDIRAALEPAPFPGRIL